MTPRLTAAQKAANATARQLAQEDRDRRQVACLIRSCGAVEVIDLAPTEDEAILRAKVALGYHAMDGRGDHKVEPEDVAAGLAAWYQRANRRALRAVS